MVTIAILYSRSEAMVLASLLDARGILVDIGGYNHASVSVIPVALGGFRFRVPEIQYAYTSEVLLEIEGLEEHAFSYGARRALIKLMLFAVVWTFTFVLLMNALEPMDRYYRIWMAPMAAIAFPANPQGCGKYYLSKPTTN